MGKLIEKAVRTARGILDIAEQSNSGVIDDVHDLQMYIDSDGNCEVTQKEALILIKKVVSARDKTSEALTACNEWLNAILE